MHALKALVRNGRILVDEPTDLPDGTVLDLIVTDAGDDLDNEERAELHGAIDEGLADMQSSGGLAASDVLARLRARQ